MWLGDAIVMVQEWVDRPDLAYVLAQRPSELGEEALADWKSTVDSMDIGAFPRSGEPPTVNHTPARMCAHARLKHGRG